MSFKQQLYKRIGRTDARPVAKAQHSNFRKALQERARAASKALRGPDEPAPQPEAKSPQGGSTGAQRVPLLAGPRNGRFVVGDNGRKYYVKVGGSLPSDSVETPTSDE